MSKKSSQKRLIWVSFAFATLAPLTFVACGSTGPDSYSSYQKTKYTKAYISSYDDLNTGMYSESSLEEVSFSAYIPKDQLIKCLNHANLKNVRTLDLSGSSISGIGQGAGKLTAAELVSALSKFTKLESLKMEEHGYFELSVVQALKKLPNLTKLMLKGCKRIDDAYLAEIGTMSNLEELDLSNIITITDSGVGYLKDLKKLKVLALGGNSDTQSPITLNCGQDLEEMTSLVDLKLEYIDLRIPAIVPFTPNLRDRLTKLNIRRTSGIYPIHFAYVAQFKNLVELDMQGCDGSVEDADLKLLYTLTSLEKLKIRVWGTPAPKITRAGINDLLKNLPKVDASEVFPNQR